ncbi:type 4a pilus biogenesis protein PilO [Methylosoma difficile]
MNLSEINWDINASGSWPLPVKAAMVLIISGSVLGAGIYFDTVAQLDKLKGIEQKEIDLKKDFEKKQNKAVNLQDYKDQLVQIETELFEMVRQMPTEAEIANLLTDISQAGLASGLDFKLFKPGAAVYKDFYTEIPISIKVVGKYEELGLFISSLASLPRIVTVHDVNIGKPVDAKFGFGSKGKEETNLLNDDLVMEATVKTYYEGQPAKAATTNDSKKRVKPNGGKQK